MISYGFRGLGISVYVQGLRPSSGTGAATTIETVTAMTAREAKMNRMLNKEVVLRGRTVTFPGRQRVNAKMEEMGFRVASYSIRGSQLFNYNEWG